MCASVGCRLPLLGLTRSDQVERPVDFQAESAREWKRSAERESTVSGSGGGGGGVEEGRVGDGAGGERVGRRIGERELGRGGEAEEGVGLVGPVEAARAARVAGGEAVLGEAVVLGGRGGGG